MFLEIQNGIINFDDLEDDSKKVLQIFSEHLAALYEKTQKGSEEILNNFSVEEKIMYFSKKFEPTSKYDLPDRIVRSFAYSAGYTSFEQLKKVVENSYKEKERISIERSRELQNGKKLELELGDFIRCIGRLDVVESSLDNGNVCKELLGTFTGTSESDTTPLDTDWTYLNVEGWNSLYECVDRHPSTGFGFGNIYLVMKKNNPALNITRDADGNLTDNKYNPNKVEMFGTLTPKGGNEGHWGALAGTATSDIDYIIFKEDETINPSKPYNEDGSINYIDKFNNPITVNTNQLALLKNEIVKNGFYIPVVDFSGKLVFSYEEYKELKDKMQGLSYYESDKYEMAKHSKDPYAERVKKFLGRNKKITNDQSRKIYAAISSAINEIEMDEKTGKNLLATDHIGIDITPGTVEVLETGSSKRGTNVPYNYDFDYIFRLDAKYLNDTSKFSGFLDKLGEKLGIENVPHGDFRDVEVEIEGLGKIKIDISFIKKTDKVEYSTEMALKDRMDTIEKINPEVKDEVTANIILAKMLLKNSGCYKPSRRDTNQGGMGGVGIENWITQNGGSLESAARSFMEVAEKYETYDEFKKHYHVHDYGKNHLYERNNKYPYDDFVFDNMNEIGYQKMKKALDKYLKYVRGEIKELPELDEMLTELETMLRKSEIEELEQLKDQLLDAVLMEESSVVEEQQHSRNRGNITVLMITLLSIITSILTVIMSLGSK